MNYGSKKSCGDAILYQRKLCNSQHEREDIWSSECTVLLREDLNRGFELWTAVFLPAFYVCQHQGFESSGDSNGQPVRRMFSGRGVTEEHLKRLTGCTVVAELKEGWPGWTSHSSAHLSKCRQKLFSDKCVSVIRVSEESSGPKR